jgi:hypothetical protein
MRDDPMKIFARLLGREGSAKMALMRRNFGRFMSLAAVALLLLIASSAPLQAQQAKPRAKSAVKPASKAAPPIVAEVLESKAIELLKAMSSRLAAARSMTFTAAISYESPSRLGPALVYTTKSEVTMQRPDKLRVITLGDGPASEFYYDGKRMLAFAPAENLVAVSAAPPTIDSALKAAYENAAIYFPFTDVIAVDPYKDISEGLKIAFYIGQSKVVGETTTDILAYVNDYVFVQIWIGAEDKLPRMLRAVFRDDPLRLRHQIELSNWQLDPTVAADAFATPKEGTAMKIPFARPDPKLPPGFKPPARPKPLANSKPTKTS